MLDLLYSNVTVKYYLSGPVACDCNKLQLKSNLNNSENMV